MQGLYKKSKIWFAIIWIILYVVLSGVADSITLGYEKLTTCIVHFLMTIIIILWLKKNDLFKEFGLCLPENNLSNVLYYIPLVVLSSVNLLFGFKSGNIFFAVSMLFVGFLEEIIFRGFLFKAIDDIKWAIAISSITFGMGHIINFLNGADFVPTICQIFSAMAFGYLFVMLFYRGKSLIPCIISHSFINVTSVFAKDISNNLNIIMSVVLFIGAVAYGAFVDRTLKERDK